VPIGSDDTHEPWHRAGSSCLLRLIAVAMSMWKVFGAMDLSSSFPVVRYLKRFFRQLMPGAEVGQCGISGRLDRLCPAGRKRSLMAYFAER
jgi:hypothetical protein